MKSFRQYISENLDNIKAYRRDLSVYNAKEYLDKIPGLVNPSREQLKGYLNKVKSARFILHNDALHVFDAADAIHDDVLRAEHPDQNKSEDFSDRVDKMYDTKKSLLGSFHISYDPVSYDPVGFHVGLSYLSPYTPEKKEWMENLLRTHKTTSHLISPKTEITPYDL